MCFSPPLWFGPAPGGLCPAPSAAVEQQSIIIRDTVEGKRAALGDISTHGTLHPPGLLSPAQADVHVLPSAASLLRWPVLSERHRNEAMLLFSVFMRTTTGSITSASACVLLRLKHSVSSFSSFSCWVLISELLGCWFCSKDDWNRLYINKSGYILVHLQSTMTSHVIAIIYGLILNSCKRRYLPVALWPPFSPCCHFQPSCSCGWAAFQGSYIAPPQIATLIDILLTQTAHLETDLAIASKKTVGPPPSAPLSLTFPGTAIRPWLVGCWSTRWALSMICNVVGQLLVICLRFLLFQLHLSDFSLEAVQGVDHSWPEIKKKQVEEMEKSFQWVRCCDHKQACLYTCIVNICYGPGHLRLRRDWVCR